MSLNSTLSDGYWRSTRHKVIATLSLFMSPPNRLWILAGTVAVPVCAFLSVKQFEPQRGLLVSYFHYTSKSPRLALAAAAISVISLISLVLLSRMIVVKAHVYNSRDSLTFSARTVSGFRSQSRNSKALVEFRQHIDDVLKMEYLDSLSKAVAIRHWVRRQQSQDEVVWMTPPRIDHEDPHRLLSEQRAGSPGACRRFSYILLGALLSAGFDARILFFSNRLRRRGVRWHTAVEAWIQELNQWVLLDPTYDSLVLVDGKVASAIELHKAIESGDLNRIAFERDGSILEPAPRVEFFQDRCRHLFVALSNAIFDGYAVRLVGRKRIRFLHYSGRARYPEFAKLALLGVGSAGLVLSLVLWTWSFVAPVAD